MKGMLKTLLLMLMTVTMLSAYITTAEAAEGKAGQTVSITFHFSDIRGVDGNFDYSNRDMFSSISYSSTFPGARFNNDKVFYSTTAAGTSDGSITITCKIKSDAAVGDSCVITMKDINLTDGNTNSVKGGTKSEIVTVVAGQNQSQIQEENPSQTQNQTQNQTQQQTQTGADTKSNSATIVKIDYEQLKKQIANAGGLQAFGYTKESWEVLTQALTNAKGALNSNSQNTVDTATVALEAALSSLVKMDYTKLQKAIDDANSFTASEEVASLLNQLTVAVNNGVLLLESDDQSTVDAAEKEINSLLEQIHKELSKEGMTEKEDTHSTIVNDYVAQSEKDCHKPMHKVWPLLFFISLALNAILLVLLHPGIRNKLRKNGDDIPLADYEIDDDEIEGRMGVEDVYDFDEEEDEFEDAVEDFESEEATDSEQ